MPEEKNRRIVDSFSDYFFTPTEISYSNLLAEGHRPDRIFLVSKLIVDVLDKYKDKIEESKIMDSLNVHEKEYILAEAHRPENVDNPDDLGNILKSFEILYDKYRKPILFFAHPRTVAAINKFNFKVPDGVKLMDYIGFFDFTKLEKNALCIMTDSGTLEEDGCWFRVPCVTYRISTERPETCMCGSNMVSGLNADKIVECTEVMMKKNTDWVIPYGLGATKRIVNCLKVLENDICSKKIWW
jgi:UDP-N-acetylglucosamine 2-epimerase (non-hydrolysing)